MRRRCRPAGLFAAACTTAIVVATVGWAGPVFAAPPRALRWLAAGDSFSSGTGLPSTSGNCRRPVTGSSSAVYSQKAAVALGASVVNGSSPTLVACSSATTSWFFDSIDGHDAEWTRGLGTFDLVTFTLGGDDVGFAQVLEQCSHYKNQGMPTDPGRSCPRESDLRRTIDQFGAGYQNFLTRIAGSVVNRGGNVVVLGYPELVEDPNRWTGLAQAVDLCFGIGRADAVELRGLAGDLNATIGYAVSQVNAKAPNGVHFSFLDVNSGGTLGIAKNDTRLFEPSNATRHNQCALDSWINGVTSNGSFHPDQRAHDAEGSMLTDVIRRLDWSGLVAAPPAATGPAPANPGAGQGATTPPTQAAAPPGTTLDAPVPVGTGRVIISPCLNLRAGPNGSSALVGCVSEYTIVTIDCTAQGDSVTGPYGATTLWDHTTYNGTAGYLSDAWLYTGKSGPVAGGCSAPPAPPPPSGGTGRIIISPCLNLRAGANGSTALVGCIPDGTTITIDCTAQGNSVTGPYGATTLWDHTVYDGTAGYVSDAWVYTGQSAPVAANC